MKKVASLALAGCLVLGSMTFSLANNNDNIEEKLNPVPILYKENVENHVKESVMVVPKEIKSETEELKINATIPVIEGLKDEYFQHQLNETIMKGAMEDIQEAKDDSHQFAEDCKKNGWPVRPNEIYIHYEVKTEDEKNNIISFKTISYYNNGGTGNPKLNFYNILNEDQARNIELKDLLGENYKEIINLEVKKQIEENKDKYFENGEVFKTISDHQGFYIDNGDVVIVFNKYEIAPGYMGTPEFRIPSGYAFDKIHINGKEINLDSKKIFKKEEGTTMLPLRILAEELGYKVKWNEDLKIVELSKGAQWITVKPGEDYYTFGKMAPMNLGTASEILDGTTYVPLNFVKDILRGKAIDNGIGVVTITTEE